MNTKKLLLYAIPAAAFLAAGVFAVQHAADATAEPTTRPLTLAPASSRVLAEGRVTTYPGKEVVVGTDFAGTLERVAVEEKQRVKKGDVVAELRADEERAALAEAKARLAEAEADLRLADVEIARARQLLEGGRHHGHRRPRPLIRPAQAWRLGRGENDASHHRCGGLGHGHFP